MAIWGLPNYVRYLRAIIIKLTPQLHHCTEAVLDAAAAVLAANEPALLQRFMTTPPHVHPKTRALVSREAANAICEVIGCWAGWDAHATAKLRDNDAVNERAKGAVRRIEGDALAVGLTLNDLMDCAVDAFTDKDIDANRRDAAVAAMSAGHFKLGSQIIAEAPSDES
jgi:hypothetical protein